LSVGFLLANLASSSFAQAPTASVGTVSGVVLDGSSGAPLIDVGVEVVGRSERTRTDLDGRYTLKLPPDTYQLRFFAAGYTGMRLEHVTIRGDAVTKADTILTATGASNVQEVDVVARADKASQAVQLLKRKQSIVAEDVVGAEVIAKSPDNHAAEIVERTPAVTILDDKFVTVRGLGPRYSSARLNGSRLPSTDPSTRVPPLDLFPASFLESVAVVKSYSPDLPGDFSGGLVELDLRDFPDQLAYDVGLSTGYDSNVTFQKFQQDQERGTLDYLGFGSYYRHLPKGIPSTDTVLGLNDDARSVLGRSFKTEWEPDTITAPPNSGLDFSIGNTVGPFGFELGGVYTTEYFHRPESDITFDNTGTNINSKIGVTDIFRYDIDRFETRLGGVFTSGYRLSDDHKITLNTFINRKTQDEILVGHGISSDEPGNLFHQTQMHYTDDELDFGQLAGEDHWSWLTANWRTAYSRTLEDEPDIRRTSYIGLPGEPKLFQNDTFGGARIFRDLKETLSDSALDFTLPFRTALPGTDFWSGLPGNFRFGAAYSYRSRDFTQRVFRYRIVNDNAVDRSLPPNQLLAPNNIVPGVINFLEETDPRDQFNATEEIVGGYGMFELPLIRDQLRAVGGARTEYTHEVVNTVGDTGQPEKVLKNNLDPLPAATLIYSPRSDMNVRATYSQSVSRPEFRELTPVLFIAPKGQNPTVGNPNLEESHITSWDLRWEWFLSPLELFSVSGFYKTIKKPIEEVDFDLAGDVYLSFKNAGDATLGGFEVEGQKDFGFISPRLKYLSLYANVAYVQSNVTIPRPTGVQVQTSTSRTLQGQAPYIVNAVLDYTNPELGTVRLFYNSVGQTLTDSGTNGLPDIFLNPRNDLDATILVPLARFGSPLTLKISAENLMGQDKIWSQEGRVQRRIDLGEKVTVGLSYHF
jgi:hypothetical protein